VKFDWSSCWCNYMRELECNCLSMFSYVYVLRNSFSSRTQVHSIPIAQFVIKFVQIIFQSDYMTRALIVFVALTTIVTLNIFFHYRGCNFGSYSLSYIYIYINKMFIMIFEVVCDNFTPIIMFDIHAFFLAKIFQLWICWSMHMFRWASHLSILIMPLVLKIKFKSMFMLKRFFFSKTQ
jgi:hypothetical protein